MAIKIPNGPSAQGTIAMQVSELRNHGVAEPLGGALPIKAAQPLAVYVCGLSALASEGVVSSAVHKGWRYLLTNGQPVPVGGTEPVGGTSRHDVAIADAMGNANDAAAFSSLTHGLPAERLVQASAVAQSEFGASPEEFEPRILEIPALNTTALWMHGATGDSFIPYLEGAGTPSAPNISENFADKIKERAAAQLQKAVTMKPDSDDPPN
jgi:hypothetical protein